MLELYLSSIPAYFCGISGVSVIFVVLNNAGSKKNTRKTGPWQCHCQLGSIYTNEVLVSVALILMCDYGTTCAWLSKFSQRELFGVWATLAHSTRKAILSLERIQRALYGYLPSEGQLSVFS